MHVVIIYNLDVGKPILKHCWLNHTAFSFLKGVVPSAQHTYRKSLFPI